MADKKIEDLLYIKIVGTQHWLDGKYVDNLDEEYFFDGKDLFEFQDNKIKKLARFNIDGKNLTKIVEVNQIDVHQISDLTYALMHKEYVNKLSLENYKDRGYVFNYAGKEHFMSKFGIYEVPRETLNQSYFENKLKEYNDFYKNANLVVGVEEYLPFIDMNNHYKWEKIDDITLNLVRRTIIFPDAKHPGQHRFL